MATTADRVYANDPTRRTNDRAIAELAQLGFLRPDDRVLDLSIGRAAVFWKQWRPDEGLVTNDIDPYVAADHHHDAATAPWSRGDGFDVVAWDGPYKYEGSRSKGNRGRGERYGVGTTGYRSAAEVDALILAGAASALRITNRIALVKCQKQNVASEFRFPDQPFAVARLAQEVGAKVVAELYVRSSDTQPKDKRQLNIWCYSSVLLVLEVP